MKNLIFKILNKFFKIFYLLITYFFSIPVLLVILILRPFFSIKIGELETRAIGHSSISIEIFLCELELKIHNKKKNEIYIWFRNTQIANKYLYEKWKKKLLILPNLFFEGAYNIVRILKLNNFFYIPYRHWKEDVFNWGIIDINDVLTRVNEKIQFSQKEMEEGNNFFKSININSEEKFICFFCRDKAFRNEKFKTARDSSIKEMLFAVNELTKKNFKAIRMGSKTLEKINNSEKIFDYSNSKYRSEFLDIFIMSKSNFVISGDTGFNHISALFRKKQLVVNYSNISSILKENYKFVKFVLPKKIIKIKDGVKVGLKEILKTKVYNIENINELNLKGYDVLDNSQEEINFALIEMYNYVQFGKLDQTYENQNYKVQSIITNHFGVSRKIPRISSIFFKKFDNYV